MQIVVASGKGGTGKTLVATSLALVAAERGAAALLDADVEAPNAALFLAPRLTEAEHVQTLVPEVDPARCTHCGRCAEVCQYHAIAALPAKTLVFRELCHGCGSCTLVCPANAIREAPRPIGLLEWGSVDGFAAKVSGLSFAQGTLDVGEAMATPVIRALKRRANDAGWARAGHLIIDAPPGTACPVIESLRGADAALLVTEPTPFGLHDLRLAVEVARDVLGIPVGVALNKAPSAKADASEVEQYCAEERLPVLLRIPLRREIAVAYSRGEPLVRAYPEFREAFAGLLVALERVAAGREP